MDAINKRPLGQQQSFFTLKGSKVVGLTSFFPASSSETAMEKSCQLYPWKICKSAFHQTEDLKNLNLD
jgi:hypothetical protein